MMIVLGRIKAMVEALERPYNEATWLHDGLERNRAEIELRENGVAYIKYLLSRIET